VIDLTRRCTRYRPVLIDFIDRGEVRDQTGAALAHLDRCSLCTEVVETTMLTITALRRMGDAAAAAEPAEDSWSRLRTRIQARRRRPATMSPLAGIAMSFAIVAVLVLPAQQGGATLLGAAGSPVTGLMPAVSSFDRQVEADYLSNSRLLKSGGSVATVGSVPFNYPREIREIRKEVHLETPSGRPIEPI
jgi:hypothetical protein